MARKTILVCGSLGFLMSNFIRYLMYRTKDFDVVSIDKISGEVYAKRRYINKAHQFYIGDITDIEFLHRILWIHKVDVIINGVNSFTQDPKTIVLGASNLSTLGVPVIQLTPCIWEQDPHGLWNSAAMLANNYGGNVLEVPNCIGVRQRVTDGAAKIIKDVLESGEAYTSEKPIPWAHAEDVSSLLWFMIEKILNDEEMPKHIRCPILGKMSTKEIAERANEKYGVNTKVLVNPTGDPSLCTSFEGSKIEGWRSDLDDFKGAVERVLEWYGSNRWALCL